MGKPMTETQRCKEPGCSRMAPYNDDTCQACRKLLRVRAISRARKEVAASRGTTNLPSCKECRVRQTANASGVCGACLRSKK